MANQKENMLDSKPVNSFTRLRTEIHALLHDDEDSALVQVASTLERVSGISRDYLFYSVVGMFVSYLIFGDLAELVCNAIGFIFPAYASYIAIDSPNKEDDTQWLVYWTVFAFFSMVDFGNRMMKTVPLYWVFKCAFLLWLYLPAYKGAIRLYQNGVVPLMQTYAPRIKQLIDDAKTKTQGDKSVASKEKEIITEELKTDQKVEHEVAVTNDNDVTDFAPVEMIVEKASAPVESAYGKVDDKVQSLQHNDTQKETKSDEAKEEVKESEEESSGFLQEGIDMVHDFITGN